MAELHITHGNHEPARAGDAVAFDSISAVLRGILSRGQLRSWTELPEAP